jgi:hypothetical protein
MCAVSGSLWGCGVTSDLIHSGYAEAEWVNTKTFARKRDEVGSTAIDKREACVCKLTYTAAA